jgi:hypothetical protein
MYDGSRPKLVVHESPITHAMNINVEIDSCMVSALNYIALWQGYFLENPDDRFLESVHDAIDLNYFFVSEKIPRLDDMIPSYSEPPKINKLHELKFILKNSEEVFKTIYSNYRSFSSRFTPDEIVKDCLYNYIVAFLEFFDTITLPENDRKKRQKLELVLEYDFNSDINEVKRRMMFLGMADTLKDFREREKYPTRRLLFGNVDNIDAISYQLKDMKFYFPDD